MAMNVRKKPFDDVRVRQAINYAINKEALAKVAFAGYAVPSEGVVPPGVEYAVKLGPWPYDPRKARALLEEAGHGQGFECELWSAYNHTTAQKVIQFLQQQLAQVGIRVRVQALEAGQRVERVESVQRPEDAGVQLYYVGWSSSTGEADWALRPLLASESWPPRLLNVAYYRSEQVDAAIQRALATSDASEKAAAYREAQEQIWKDAPWAFLVTEKILYARSKRLSGVYVLPDAAFDFVDAELK
jgi:glutathione transport system substrate-binding protein